MTVIVYMWCHPVATVIAEGTRMSSSIMYKRNKEINEVNS
jgi:hypothetical protein